MYILLKKKKKVTPMRLAQIFEFFPGHINYLCITSHSIIC